MPSARSGDRSGTRRSTFAGDRPARPERAARLEAGVGWDIEIMTAEELEEVIEKAVKAFEKIDLVDVELAERLVEQGILSYDDLSVMEITDLVNTIEGLTEEDAVQIVAKAEVLAEAQTEELPRRKGA